MQMTPNINFSYFWDKLNNSTFTTFRSWTLEKEKYYHSKLNKKFHVWKVQNDYPYKPDFVIFDAWLKDVKVIPPSEIPQSVIDKDVSLHGVVVMAWHEKILKMDKIIILTLSKTKTLKTED